MLILMFTAPFLSAFWTFSSMVLGSLFGRLSSLSQFACDWIPPSADRKRYQLRLYITQAVLESYPTSLTAYETPSCSLSSFPDCSTLFLIWSRVLLLQWRHFHYTSVLTSWRFCTVYYQPKGNFRHCQDTTGHHTVSGKISSEILHLQFLGTSRSGRPFAPTNFSNTILFMTENRTDYGADKWCVTEEFVQSAPALDNNWQIWIIVLSYWGRSKKLQEP